MVAIKEVVSLFSAMRRFCLVGWVSVRRPTRRLSGPCLPTLRRPPTTTTMLYRPPTVVLTFECEPADGIHPHKSHDDSETFPI